MKMTTSVINAACSPSWSVTRETILGASAAPAISPTKPPPSSSACPMNPRRHPRTAESTAKARATRSTRFKSDAEAGHECPKSKTEVHDGGDPEYDPRDLAVRPRVAVGRHEDREREKTTVRVVQPSGASPCR